jgi:UDP-N-acetylglucosamine--N-acetylmuramyl-(pentapeptide) pyrophosphoryl-undecaprenol N-acetylglucosamine transferase
MRAAFAESGLEGEVTPFIADMPAAFAEADLVVCRSGAGAVSELAAAGKPSILVPFPFAADDHQTRNAEAIERGGAARLVRDAEMNGENGDEAAGARVGRSGGRRRSSPARRARARRGKLEHGAAPRASSQTGRGAAGGRNLEEVAQGS